MNKHASICIFLVMMLLIIAADSGFSDGFESFPDPVNSIDINKFYSNSCGFLSLFIILKANNVDVDVKDVIKWIEDSKYKGTSFATMSILAEDYGFHTKGIRCKYKDLPKLKMYAILHEQNDHFVAITGYADGGIQVVDFPDQPKSLRINENNMNTPCNVLLVSKEPILLGEENQALLLEDENIKHFIRPSQKLFDIGEVQSEATVELSLENITDNTVWIKSIIKSCRCVQSELEKGRLESGEVVSLKLTVFPGDEYGDIFHKVFIKSTDSDEEDLVSINIKGTTMGNVQVMPPVMTMDNIIEGEECVRELKVLTARNTEELIVDVPENLPLLYSFEADSDNIPLLLLHWYGSEELGWHRDKLFIKDRNSNEILSKAIYFAVNVIPKIKYSPKIIVFRPDEDESFARTINIYKGSRAIRVDDVSYNCANSVFNNALEVLMEDKDEYIHVSIYLDNDELKLKGGYRTSLIFNVKGEDPISMSMWIM